MFLNTLLSQFILEGLSTLLISETQGFSLGPRGHVGVCTFVARDWLMVARGAGEDPPGGVWGEEERACSVGYNVLYDQNKTVESMPSYITPRHRLLG